MFESVSTEKAQGVRTYNSKTKSSQRLIAVTKYILLGVPRGSKSRHVLEEFEKESTGMFKVFLNKPARKC